MASGMLHRIYLRLGPEGGLDLGVNHRVGYINTTPTVTDRDTYITLSLSKSL